ncbi:MAG: flagellar assembly protein FliW [Clostridiaceae bacterium]
MIIQTRFFGEVEINEEEIFEFPEGILGFEESRRFVLLDVPKNELFKIFQDVDRKYVSFVIAVPWGVQGGYDISIPDEDLFRIKIQRKEQVLVMNIVTMPEALENSTINLLAPLVMNVEARLGRQYVLSEGRYTTRHPLYFSERGEANADIK